MITGRRAFATAVPNQAEQTRAALLSGAPASHSDIWQVETTSTLTVCLYFHVAMKVSESERDDFSNSCIVIEFGYCE